MGAFGNHVAVMIMITGRGKETKEKIYPCEGREVVYDRSSAQIKHIKIKMEKKYNNEEAMLKVNAKKTVEITNNTVTEAKEKTDNNEIEK